MTEMAGETGPTFDLRQNIGDARRRHEIVAGPDELSAIVAFGKIGFRLFRKPQSVTGKQRGIAAGQPP